MRRSVFVVILAVNWSLAGLFFGMTVYGHGNMWNQQLGQSVDAEMSAEGVMDMSTEDAWAERTRRRDILRARFHGLERLGHGAWVLGTFCFAGTALGLMWGLRGSTEKRVAVRR